MQKPGTLTICLLIAILLITGLGSAFGFVICDQGCLSDIHHENHHAGEESHDPEPLPYYPVTDNQDDGCCDTLISIGDGCLEDETRIVCPLSDGFYPSSVQLIPETASNLILTSKFKTASSSQPQALELYRSVILII